MGDIYTNPPQSRNEAILNSIIEGTEYTDPPQSRIEDLLLELKGVIVPGESVIIDDEMSEESTHPVENQAITKAVNFKLANSYKGKNAVHMGDSWVHTYGIGEAAADVLGYTVINCGFSASSISDYNEAFPNAKYFSVIELAKALQNNVWTDQDAHAGTTWGGQLEKLKNVNWAEIDLLILSYGLNDLSAQNPLGDTSARDELSVCGALKAAVKIFQNLNENMEIICTTPCYRQEPADDSTYVSYNERILFEDYVYAIGMTCKELGVKCIDMRALSGINAYNQSVCYLSDRLHPTELGKAKWVHGFTNAMQSGFYGTIDTSNYHRIESDNLIFDSEKFTRHKQWNATYVHTNGKKYLCTRGTQIFREIVFGMMFFTSLPVGAVIAIEGYGLCLGDTSHRIGISIRNADFSASLHEKYKAAFSITENQITLSETTAEEYTNCWVIFYAKNMCAWADGIALARDMKCTITLPTT